MIVDYNKKTKAEIKMWEDMCRYILRAKKSSSGRHSDKYMARYYLNTIMLVGCIRETEGHCPMDREHAEEHEPSIQQRRAIIMSTLLFSFVKRTSKVEVNIFVYAHL